MTLLLVGDIGGTKTLLRLVEVASGEGKEIALQQEIRYEALYPSQEYADLVPIVRQFFGEAASELGNTPAPSKACLAIAGPVVGDTSVLTNLGWSLDAKRLKNELGIPKLGLINDFAGVGYGVLSLPPSDIHTLQAGTPQPAAPIAVIGAGTGLGEGFLISQQDGEYRIYPSEGGHADFAPRTELEFELLQDLRRRYNLDRVSVERVVSGPGILSIYEFLRSHPASGQENPTTDGKDNLAKKSPQEISVAAIEKSDRLCEQAMQIFVEAYAAEAGNLAIKLLPYGGLYLAGGIAGKILPAIEEDNRFMRAFNQKGRVSPLLEAVPVHIVLNQQVGLLGATVYAAGL